MTNPAPKNSPATDLLAERFAPRLEHLEQRLGNALPNGADRLAEAMRYAVLGGGKRIRPLLAYASARALRLHETQVDAIALAVEIIHAYSLVHDDLPAMDDDDLRRGRPTCHRKFDEATAILAGDALQALAFEILANDPPLSVNPAAQVKIMGQLANACGAQGMAGGQALDLAAVGRTLNSDELKAMHRLKTGALIRFSVAAPAWFAGVDDDSKVALDRYGWLVGLAFQIHDDVLDETGDVRQLGKPIASDRKQEKPTFAGVMGLEASREQAFELREKALACLGRFGADGDDLAFLARYAVERER